MAEVVATYPDPESARRAITTLERHGIDAADIHLLGAQDAHRPMIGEALDEPDEAVTREVGRRSLGTAVVASLLLAAVGAAIGWFASDGDSLGTLLGAVGGFVFGGAAGFFYGGASGLSVSEEWSDTFETTGPTTVAVHVDEEGLGDLRDRVESTRPDRIMVS